MSIENFGNKPISLTPPEKLFQTKNNAPILTPPEELFKNIPKISKKDSLLKTLKTLNDNISISNIFTKKSPSNLGSISNVNFAFTNSSNEVLNLPSRKNNAITGSQFIESTKGLPRDQRENMILKEVLSGNVPDFARNLKNVQVATTDSKGFRHTGTIKVMPDYIAIGSNKDFIRVPMNPLTAQKIADRTGTILPTKKIVNEIYAQAEAKMTPQPIKASAQMMSSEYYQDSNNKIEQQRANKGFQLGQLMSGHKKDVVITNRLDANPQKVAIYGWHQPNGKAIQPLSTIHENTYADYSHGVRLVSNTMIVDGRERNVADVLHDPELSKMLSDEGIINNTKIKN